MAELQALGVPPEPLDEALHVMFPKSAESLRTSTDDTPPTLDILHMDSDDALCHTRIVGNRLH